MPIGRSRAEAAGLATRYEELMAEFGPALHRVAANYEFDRALREDLFQEICLAVWKALPRFRGDSSLKTFVYRIAHNRGLSHGWRASRAPVSLEDPERVHDVAPSPEERVERKRRHERLVHAMRELPVLSRQILALRLEGLSYEEISEVTGLSSNAAMIRASRARTALQELLARGGTEER